MRGGRSPWKDGFDVSTPRLVTENTACDVLIVGCGITGALMAERLTRRQQRVMVIDRELPGRGSTAASTAMLLWEIDRSLSELTNAYGFDRAARAWRASYQAVGGLGALVRELGITCDWRDRRSLCLAAGDTAQTLIAETALRHRAGLPGAFLDHRALLTEFDMARPGAILSPDSADADPVQLAHGLLDIAVARGAGLYEAEAVDFDWAGGRVGVMLDNGHLIDAGTVVIATGYVRPKIIRTTLQTTNSSWAIATRPQPDALWKDGALIWEDSDDYLYARTTAAGRLIIGGEDSSSVIEPAARDAAIPAKARILAKKLAALWPHADTSIDLAWAGTFDTTSDGLPLIGPAPGARGIYAAFGYGGNGITFSFLAATLIGDLIDGANSILLDDFALDRDGAPSL